MKVHLYYLPPFKTFGVGWVLLNEDDEFWLFNGHPTFNEELPNDQCESLDKLLNIIELGENPHLELVNVTVEEASQYIQMSGLLE